jgi:hypothetical protein
MKRCSLTIFLLHCAIVCVAGQTPPADEEEEFPPRVKPISAYERLRSKSPFEFDVRKPPVEAAINPFEGISLAGYCGKGDTLTVYLLSGKEKKRITVFGDGSPFKKHDTSGFRVVGIKRGRTLQATKVILEKDGQRGTLMFDEEILHSPNRPAPGGLQKVRGPNGAMGLRPNIPKPMAGANAAQVYKAPEPFIPGRSQPQQPTPPLQAGGNKINSPVPLPNPVLTNKTNAPTFPANGITGSRSERTRERSDMPRPRRRVVLPTQ